MNMPGSRMADIVDKATRSRMMAGIRSKHTRPELRLRRALHACGLRFRLHARNLPGHPDLLFPRYRAVVFVHGCFWHRHSGCRFATTPATRTEFWEAKFSANIARDEVVLCALRQSGWRVGVVWECELRQAAGLFEMTELIERWLKDGGEQLGSGLGWRADGQPDCRRT